MSVCVGGRVCVSASPYCPAQMDHLWWIRPGSGAADEFLPRSGWVSSTRITHFIQADVDLSDVDLI